MKFSVIKKGNKYLMYEIDTDYVQGCSTCGNGSSTILQEDFFDLRELNKRGYDTTKALKIFETPSSAQIYLDDNYYGWRDDPKLYEVVTLDKIGEDDVNNA